jgi:hypothetical protein
MSWLVRKECVLIVRSGCDATDVFSYAQQNSKNSAASRCHLLSCWAHGKDSRARRTRWRRATPGPVSFPCRTQPACSSRTTGEAQIRTPATSRTMTATSGPALQSLASVCAPAATRPSALPKDQLRSAPWAERVRHTALGLIDTAPPEPIEGFRPRTAIERLIVTTRGPYLVARPTRRSGDGVADGFTCGAPPVVAVAPAW